MHFSIFFSFWHSAIIQNAPGPRGLFNVSGCLVKLFSMLFFVNRLTWKYVRRLKRLRSLKSASKAKMSFFVKR